MKSILITGGLGFVGSHLTELLSGKFDLTVVDNCSAKTHHIVGGNHRYVFSSVQQYLGSCDKKFDYIFHLAAHARIQPSFDTPSHTFSNNVEATLSVAEHARTHGGKIIYATTSSSLAGEYVSPYTFSKVTGEKILKMYSEIYGTDFSVARFFNVYGEREPQEGEYATVVAKFLRQRREKSPLTIVGDGKQRREFTYVGDICSGMVNLAFSERSRETWDLASGKSHSVIEIAQMVCRDSFVEGKDFVYVPLRKREALKYDSQWEKTLSEIGWKSQKTLTDYLKAFSPG